MCKVIQYQFTCDHYLKLRRSRCRGTKVKKSRSSLRAACCAEAYINIKLPLDCNKCQQEAWIERWKSKIERATSFRNGLIRWGLPGVEEISELVIGLENEYADAVWELRRIFPPYHGKTDVERVEIKYTNRDVQQETRKNTLLSREVQPHEVEPADEKDGSNQVNKDDEDFVHSTDPFHPISTDYSHLLDNTDDTWLLDQFSAEDLQCSISNVEIGFDYMDSGWTWGGDDAEPHDNRSKIGHGKMSDKAGKDADWNKYSEQGERIVDTQSSSAPEISMNGLGMKDEIRETKIEDIIEAFWDIVNKDIDARNNLLLRLQRPLIVNKSSLESLLQELSLDKPNINTIHSISDAEGHYDTNNNSTTYSSLYTQLGLGSTCRGKPSDSPSPNLPSLSFSTRPLPPLARDPIRLRYNKMRQIAQKCSNNNMKLYYAQLLHISRMEIRELVGEGGFRIPDPSHTFSRLETARKYGVGELVSWSVSNG